MAHMKVEPSSTEDGEEGLLKPEGQEHQENATHRVNQAGLIGDPTQSLCESAAGSLIQAAAL